MQEKPFVLPEKIKSEIKIAGLNIDCFMPGTSNNGKAL